MAKYPLWRAFNRITAAKLDAMIPDFIVKQSSDARINTTYVVDSELQGIDLDVGIYEIECLFFITGDTGDVKTRWPFTGSWNIPIRTRFGPDTGSTSPTATSVALNGVNAGADASYGLASTTNFATINEVSRIVQVTTAGTMSIEFAKATASGSDTTMRPQSSVKWRRVG